MHDSEEMTQDNTTKEDENSPYLAGKLLLAMPRLGDPRFHRSVIYMCAHDAAGAMGLVINHRMPGVAFQDLLEQLEITSDIEIDLKKLSLPVMRGGPVDAGRGFLLHSNDFSHDATIKFDDDFSVSGTVEALQAAAQGGGPSDLLFILGYAGWSAGQLDAEIQQNSWLVADPDPAIIFHGNHDEKWGMAVGALGFDPAMLSGDAGRA